MFWTLLFSLLAFQSFGQNPNCIDDNLNTIQEKQLWNHSQWLRLLHMREGFFSPNSEVDGPVFFTSKDGFSSPKNELIETVKAFCGDQSRETESKAIPSIQPRCQFPARESFLKGQGLGGWPTPSCPQLEDWKRKVGNTKVHLVFSSYYANNPSSVFGHTLLRFDRSQSDTNQLFNPLLSYGINFAGEPTTSNPALYALLGMTGGFRGVFASLPYYYKVREYTDFDSRDLWEYELNLSDEQRDLLLNHIWEQGFTHYNYYYFTENCSYHLLTTLDVAVPEYHLADKIPYWVIPVDTVKAVHQKSPGLVKKIAFRPSLFRQFHERMKRLERMKITKGFDRYLKTNDFPESYSEEEKAYVMDTVLDYWDFKHSKKLLDAQSPQSKEKMKHLKVRAKLPMTDRLEFKASDYEQPDLSHETLRAGLSYQRSQLLGESYELDLRFALHDLLDPQIGYPKTAQIEFFRFKAAYYSEKDQIKLTDFKFFDVQLLSPLNNSLEKTYSWKALTAITRENLDCENCLTGKLLMQGGGTLGFMDETILFYGLAGADIKFSPRYENENLKAIPVGTIGARAILPFNFALALQSHSYLNSIYALPNSSIYEGEMRQNFNLNHALGAKYSKEIFSGFNNEVSSFTYYYYF